jgi:hypothetical protein
MREDSEGLSVALLSLKVLHARQGPREGVSVALLSLKVLHARQGPH